MGMCSRRSVAAYMEGPPSREARHFSCFLRILTAGLVDEKYVKKRSQYFKNIELS